MFVHGDNLSQKESSKDKYSDSKSKAYLKEIRVAYNEWMNENLKLKGPFEKKEKEDVETIRKRIKLFTDYKDFIDQQKYAEAFDSRSNLHSSVLEEFMYYLFKDLVSGISKDALVGKSHTLKDIFFLSPNFKSMVTIPDMRIEKKDHDFVIGVNIQVKFNCKGQTRTEAETFDIPAVAIECKTYLDKTMLEGASNSGQELKIRNPSALYIVVAEWLKLTEDVNLHKYKVDQIYILRKQKNTDREYRFLPSYKKNQIAEDVVINLFELVRDHLTTDWKKSIQFGLERGWLK